MRAALTSSPRLTAVYCCPHATSLAALFPCRAQGVTVPLTGGAKFSLARDEDDKPGRIKAGAGRSSLPPGGAVGVRGMGNTRHARILHCEHPWGPGHVSRRLPPWKGGLQKQEKAGDW